MGKLDNSERQKLNRTQKPCHHGWKDPVDLARSDPVGSAMPNHSHWMAGALQSWPWDDHLLLVQKTWENLFWVNGKEEKLRSHTLFLKRMVMQSVPDLMWQSQKSLSDRNKQRDLRASALAETSTASMPCHAIPRAIQAGHRVPQEAVKSPSMEACMAPLDQALTSLVWCPFLLQKKQLWQGLIHCELHSDSAL